MQRYGTSHFVTVESAIAYYADYEDNPARAVELKLAEGSIQIGPPTLKPGQVARVIRDEGRYEICEGDHTLVIQGYRWFDRAAGNTYCRARIVLNGESVHITDYEYGYGDYYLQAAFEWLDSNGLVPARLPHEAKSAWAERCGITLDYNATQVTKRVLKSL